MILAEWNAIVAAPGFRLGVRCDEACIREIVFLPEGDEREPSAGLAPDAARQLRAYLRDPSFRFDLPLAPAGTAFQRAVWSAISAIPLGATRGYGAIARELRSAPRAVGQACGRNPYPIVVPCHRVIAAGRRIGGFANARDGYLLAAKRWLLAHEGAL